MEDLPADEPYDLIISGLPLNNFSVADVERILEVMHRLLRPGGTLSFFEYIAIRPARALVSGPTSGPACAASARRWTAFSSPTKSAAIGSGRTCHRLGFTTCDMPRESRSGGQLEAVAANNFETS